MGVEKEGLRDKVGGDLQREQKQQHEMNSILEDGEEGEGGGQSYWCYTNNVLEPVQTSSQLLIVFRSFVSNQPLLKF